MAVTAQSAFSIVFKDSWKRPRVRPNSWQVGRTTARGTLVEQERMTAAEFELLAAVRRRALDPATRTDQWELSPTIIAPVASEAELSRVESRLELRIPSLLRQVYLGVGNGGFGPGYGLMGLTGGFTDDQGHSAADLYELFRRPDPTALIWEWPARVVPICHWGCAIYSCVDCSTDHGQILIWDPNVWDEGAPVRTALRRGHRRVADWFQSWVQGDNIWDSMFRDVSPAS